MLFSHHAYSRILFDGHVGFGFTPENDEENELIFEGLEVGLRLGPTLGPLILGVDASYGWTQSETTLLSSGIETDMKKYDLGGFLGFEFIKLLRVWGSYYVVSEMSFDYNGSPKLKGTAAGGGVGMTVLPYVSLNAEVKFYNMNKFTIDGKTTTWTGDDKVEPIEVIVTIGFIF